MPVATDVSNIPSLINVELCHDYLLGVITTTTTTTRPTNHENVGYSHFACMLVAATGYIDAEMTSCRQAVKDFQNLQQTVADACLHAEGSSHKHTFINTYGWAQARAYMYAHNMRTIIHKSARAHAHANVHVRASMHTQVAKVNAPARARIFLLPPAVSQPQHTSRGYYAHLCTPTTAPYASTRTHTPDTRGPKPLRLPARLPTLPLNTPPLPYPTLSLLHHAHPPHASHPTSSTS